MKSIETQILIKEIDDRGYGIGIYNGKKVKVLNALPSENILVKIYKYKKGSFWADNIEILNKSEYRIDCKEEHFLSCSPLQILEISEENKLKQESINNLFKSLDEQGLPNYSFYSDLNEYGYRNKVEFSFYGYGENQVSLAYHKRESGFSKYMIEGCLLLPDYVNIEAKKIVSYLNKKAISAKLLKGLLCRYSFFNNQVYITVFVKDKNIDFSEIENLIDDRLVSISVVHSDPRSPAFIETEIYKQFGDNTITEKINDYIYKYPYYGFFQINPNVFSQTIKDINTIIKNISNSKDFIVSDMYSGVGTIGIAIASNVKKVYSLELTPNIEKFVLLNADANHVNNIEFIQGKSEILGENFLKKSDLVIVDPPRSGLHKDFITMIKEIKPKYILYLSCNPQTQAEDYKNIMDIYKIKYAKGYNFYPHTPHAENLLLLELK